MGLSINPDFTASTATPMDIEEPNLWFWLPPKLYYEIFSDRVLSGRDLLNASLVCRQWRFYIGHHRVAQRLLDRLPPIPTTPRDEPWLKTYGYWSQFPTEHRGTQLNYKIGQERLMRARQNRFEIVPGDAGTLEIYNYEHQHASNNTQLLGRVHLLSPENTMQLTQKNAAHWGNKGALMVISASKTGDLFGNILHHSGYLEE